MCRKLFFTIFLFLFLLNISIAFAQCDPNLDPFCSDPDTPLDAAVIFLLIAGAYYGFKKLKKVGVNNHSGN